MAQSVPNLEPGDYDKPGSQPSDTSSRPDLRAIGGQGQTTPRRQGHLRDTSNSPDVNTDEKKPSSLSDLDVRRSPYDQQGNVPESKTAAGQQPSQKTPWRPWNRGPKTSPDSPKRAAENLKDREGAAGGTGDVVPKAERSMYKPSPQASSEPSRLKSLFRTRQRKILGIGGITGTIIGLFFGFSVVQGPLQIIHFAQFLQRAHFTRSENFGDDRGGKVLIYALAGKAQMGRLGIVGNKAANAWEKSLLKETGLRPAYSQITRRFVGFEIIDEDKFLKHLLGVSDKGGKYAKRVEEAMGKGAEIRTAGEAGEGKQNLVNSDNKKLDLKTKVIDLRVVKGGERRKFIRTIGRTTDTLKIASTVGSRLLIKRGGIDFHPSKNPKRLVADFVFDKWQARKDAAKRIKEGVKPSNSLGIDDSKDEKGNPNQSDEDKAATKEANKALEEAKKAAEDLPDPSKTGGETLKSIRTGIAKAAGPAMAIGIMCTAKSFGDDIPQYKYDNNAMPMMRMGMRVITMGNQVMSGQDVNLDELGAFQEAFYDPETKTTWTQATSIQQEMGNAPTQYDLPKEAQLKNIDDKPWLFDTLDKVPGLGETCGALGAVAGIPVIRDILGAISSASMFAINAFLSTAGTSMAELTEKALATAAGQSVNLLASGAEFGNLANTGAFLAGNDHAISMGGAPMSKADAVALRDQERTNYLTERASLSITQRLFDRYDRDSLVGKIIDRSPASTTQLASFFADPLKIFKSGFSSLFASFPRAYAVEAYDYGAPTYGFTLAEQQDERFDDPYDNAVIVEQNLDALNNKYGKCFSTKIVADGDSIRLETNQTTNVFKISDDSDCNDKSDDLLRYRFYIADTVSALSLACWEGDEDSCTQIGFGQTTGSTAAAPSTTPSVSAPPLSSLGGQQLNANQTKWIKYIAENVVPSLPGSADQKATMAANGTWWSLREGELSLDNPIGYSLCHVPPDTKFTMVQVCAEGFDHPWQVGIAAVQVPNPSTSDVIAKAQELNHTSNLKDILSRVSTLSGYPQGTPEYDTAVNSTGYLQKSLLLRDPVTGFYFVDREVTNECLKAQPERWCVGNSFSPNLVGIKAIIAELKAYFQSSSSTTTPNTTPSGTVQQLAQQILAVSNISYPLDATSPNGSTKSVLQAIAQGQTAPVTCRDGSAGGTTSVNINPNILQMVLELGQQTKIGVNALTDKCHSTGSNHYKGLAVDFECKGVLFDISRADPIAAKYGARRNNETCSTNSHWHYEISQ